MPTPLRITIFGISAFLSNAFIAFLSATVGLWTAVLMATAIDVTLFVGLVRL